MIDTSGHLGEVARRITAPFGARPLSAAQLAAQADANSRPAGIVAEKWRVLHDLTAARARFGLSPATLFVLEALLTFLPETVLAPNPDNDVDLVVFPSNRALTARARGLSEAALRRHVSALVEVGLVIRRDSPNGKRYVRRGEHGQIEHAFGFDLTPLALRAVEIAAMAQAVRADALAQRLARETVSLLRRDCSKLLDALEHDDGIELTSGPSADELRVRFRALLAAYPRRPDPADVRTLANGLDALALAVSAALTARVESKKVSGTAARSECHIQSSKPDAPVVEEASGDAEKPAPVPDARGVPADVAGFAIRSTYPLNSVLEACPQVQDFSASGIRSWRDLLQTADYIRPLLGISPTAWSDAQDVMGPEAAAITLAAILERSEHIKSPGGYLRTLTERKRAGTFSLGPVLQALRRARLTPRLC